MSQVDISLFSTITQPITVFGLIIYSFWLVSAFYFFISTFNLFYIIVNKNCQTITLLFNKF